MPQNLQGLLLPLVLFAGIGVMLFFNVRKQKARAADMKAMLDAIVPGTRVMTTSGLHATVTAIADDTIELEISPGVRTTWARAVVREVVVAVPADASELDEDGQLHDLADLDDRGSSPVDPTDTPVRFDKRSTDLG